MIPVTSIPGERANYVDYDRKVDLQKTISEAKARADPSFALPPDRYADSAQGAGSPFRFRRMAAMVCPRSREEKGFWT